VNPLIDLLFRTLETIANGASRLDPLTHARLQRLAGRRIALHVDPPGETATLCFEGGAVQLEAGMAEAPNVLLRGTPGALLGVFLDASARNEAIAVEGDEVLLTELREIVRDYHPDGFPPLDAVVGSQAADSLTTLFEVGIAAIRTLGRNVGDESRRLVRDGVRRRLLTRTDQDVLLGSLATLRLRLDRASARVAVLEQRGRIGQ
jgi:ubiquinone biosynthesis protein UbiJ